ncbi:PGL/p-HBAD biosynthesis glycosyltransferase [Polaribacter huanghezhanensis]|uniref:glycosyltransferase family 2 protein n=1 Tax=Polaribacter huanghezhanensis TaxID=1354726 RepID=UPI0026487C59|nr:glycosyltransferase family 2 protein [Polaribacter huanghezhanensis]WKD85552.1 PGL/p-HBAD biosynthesis glycosyltransferase [Polaribacter huanghezhanensis]
MKTETPLFSIVTVSYNSEKTIRDTIKSVLNQVFTNFEYILVDGKSTDKTVEIIKSFENQFKEKKIPYQWISEKDAGIYDAMNKGLKLASGEIIGILNSDDWYTKTAISTVVEKNQNNTNTIISGKKNKVNSKKEILKTIQNKKDIAAYIHKIMPINHPATFVHKTVYDKIGLFDTQYKLSADYDLIYRAFNANASFLFVDEVLVNMRNTGATHQSKNLFITAKEDYHIRKKNKVTLAFFYYLKRIGFNYLVIIRGYLFKNR